MGATIQSQAVATPKAQETKYQHYRSSTESVRVVAPNGMHIAFVNFQYVTSDQYVIDFLNKEIKGGGLRDISIGAVMTREEADPMSAIKAKWEAEWEAKQLEKAKAAALGKLPAMGNTIVKETGGTVQPLGALVAADVAGGASA